MRHQLGRYIRYLIQIISMSHESVAHFRVDYMLRIARAIVESLLGLIMVETIYQLTPTLSGWSQGEVLLVYGLMQLIGSVVVLIFGSGFEGLSRNIVTGRLDHYLLLPIDSQFVATTRFIFVTNFFRIGINFCIVLFAFSKLTIVWSLPMLFFSATTILSGLVIYYSLMMLTVSLSFWTFNGDLWYLMDSIAGVLRYPVDIFPTWIRLIFTVIPILFVATVPAQVILGRSVTFAILSPFIAFIMWYFTRVMWSRGLKSYQSASS